MRNVIGFALSASSFLGRPRPYLKHSCSAFVTLRNVFACSGEFPRREFVLLEVKLNA
jgi:hypothetical protein